MKKVPARTSGASSSSEPSSERSLYARGAAHISWFNTDDRSARTAPARAALEAKFLEQADGNPIRAQHLRKAYYAKLAAKSAVARRRARQNLAQAEAAEAELAELEPEHPEGGAA